MCRAHARMPPAPMPGCARTVRELAPDRLWPPRAACRTHGEHDPAIGVRRAEPEPVRLPAPPQRPLAPWPRRGPSCTARPLRLPRFQAAVFRTRLPAGPGRALRHMADPHRAAAEVHVLPAAARAISPGRSPEVTPLMMYARHHGASVSASSARTCPGVIALDFRTARGWHLRQAATFGWTTPSRSARRIARCSSARVVAIVVGGVSRLLPSSAASARPGLRSASLHPRPADSAE